MKYFAYGSNMFTQRLKERVPSAKSPVKATLPGYVLKFNKRSRDNSSKCSIVRTDNPDDIVYGVVFDIEESEKPMLDRYEGLNSGYSGLMVEVISPDGELPSHTYIVAEDAVDESLDPYDWYKALVLKGAIEHNLPTAYIEKLEAVVAKKDPDTERAKRNQTAI